MQKNDEMQWKNGKEGQVPGVQGAAQLDPPRQSGV